MFEEKEEARDITDEQVIARIESKVELLKILDEEEIHWYRSWQENWLLKGDNNTEFFHRVANGRKRKHTIYSLQDGEMVITGDENLLKHASDYYRDLFGSGSGNAFDLDPELWPKEENVSSHENLELVRPFDMEEIKKALFSMEKNKASDPDGYPIEFF
jgi:hypothetical protein